MKILSLLSATLLLACINLTSARAQETRTLFYNANAHTTLIGKGWAPEVGEYYNTYGRADTLLYKDLQKNTKSLFSNSSGLMVSFKTNSRYIKAEWELQSYHVGNNMTAIAHSGLDLYIKENGKWVFAGVGRPTGERSSHTLVENMDGEMKECLIYLPLYNSLQTLDIGVDASTVFEVNGNPFEKRIVVYGSSITQGASASRPGMSYTARIGRSLGVEIINLGVSGSGKMEKDAAHLTAAVDADMYVLDCAANPSPEEISERTNYMVKHIREKHPDKPIVMIQSVVREMGNFDLKVRERVRKQNENFAAEYQRLRDEGVQNLYLIEGRGLLGDDHEGTTDGIHPNDIGFSRMIDVIEPALKRILFE